MTYPAVRPRERIRDWVKDAIAKGGDINVIADMCAEALVNDPEFVEAFILETVPPMALKIADKLTEHGKTVAGVKRIGSKVMRVEQIAQMIDNAHQSTWVNWMRKNDVGEEIAILSLTKLQLLSMANAAFDRGNAAYKEGVFLRAIASSLRDQEVVADRWTRESLDDLFERLSVNTQAQPYLKKPKPAEIADEAIEQTGA